LKSFPEGLRCASAHRRLGVDDLSEAMDVPRGGRQMQGSHLRSDGNFEKLGTWKKTWKNRKMEENYWKMTGKWLESGNLEDDCRTFGT